MPVEIVNSKNSKAPFVMMFTLFNLLIYILYIYIINDCRSIALFVCVCGGGGGEPSLP